MSPHRRVSAQRPPSANGRESRAYRGRRGPPPKTSSTEAFWAHKGLFFFVLVPVVGAKVEIGPHFFSLVHFHSEMAVSLSPFGPWIQPLSGDAVAAATPTSLSVPLHPPMRGTWTTRQTKISLFSISVGSVPSGEARLVAGAHISMAVLGTATRWTGGTEL